jgi:hypothetical protein
MILLKSGGKNTLEEAEEPESEPIEVTMTVSKLSEGLGFTDVATDVLDDNDSYN